MKRRVLVCLIAIAAASCAAVGPEIKDNPRITPTSMTGVTSARGQNVYEKIPVPAPSATPAPAPMPAPTPR